MSRPLMLAGLVAAAALVLTSCSGDSESDSSPSWEDSPLGKIMSQAYGYDPDPDAMQERFQAEEKQRQELMAECMSEQGFEYVPHTPAGMFDWSGDEYDPESEEWVSQWGYGAVDWPGRDEMVNPGEEDQDPNQKHVEEMSESERQAYYEALYGPQPDPSEIEEDGSYEWNWETAGCQGKAQHELQAENPLESDEHKQLMEAINAFYMESAESPEMADIDAKWASCMADAGHDGFTRQQDAAESIYQELNTYYESQSEAAQAEEGVQQPSPEDDPELKKIQEQEVELALADLKCREKTNYRDEQMKVQYKLEEQFISEHKAEFDALQADLDS